MHKPPQRMDMVETQREEIERLEKEFVRMWDKGEFMWNYHEGDVVGSKEINPWRIWTVFIKPTLTSLTEAHKVERQAIIDTAWEYMIEAVRKESWSKKELEETIAKKFNIEVK